MLEGTLEIIQEFQFSCPEVGCHSSDKLLPALSKLTLNTFRDGAATTKLNRLIYCVMLKPL